MLERKKSSQKTEQNWFYFSTALFHGLCSDYISIKLLFFLEPLTTALTILPKMVEVAEKSLKLFITINNKSTTALSDSMTIYGHNIEKLRIECASFNNTFDDADIKEVTKELCDKGGEFYQFLRYGSQKTTEGFSANLDHLMPVLDKIFFTSIMTLPGDEKRLLNFTCILKSLLTASNFDQSRNSELLKNAISHNNIYIFEYINYCNQLDVEYLEQVAKFQKLKDK